MELIHLRCGAMHAEVLPDVAGGLGRLDWGRHALLRPYVHVQGAPAPATSQLACFPLVPWSNRIDPAGFLFEGRRIVPPPNRPGEPCPIHGDGWQHRWRVEAVSSSGVNLLLDRRDAASCSSPFSYVARLRYVLTERALQVTLDVSNTGADRMPFGLGLHPWLERRKGVRLRAGARGSWTRDGLGLPLEAIELPPEWDFRQAKALPDTHVDHLFRGWDGKAEVHWPDTGVSLAIEADMDYFILYAAAGRDVFCFEPVDHAINAFNLPGGAARNGLSILAPGQTRSRRVVFRVGDSMGAA